MSDLPADHRKKKVFSWKQFCKISIILCSCIFLLCLTGCITTFLIIHHKLKQADMLEDWEKTDGTICRDIIYDEVKKNTYDMYLPTKYPKRETSGMLFIHGGSWNSGKKEDCTYACRRYVKEGYVTAALNYSLAEEGKKYNFFTMLDDITSCLEHLKKRAAEAGYPIRSIALSGYSAGGHLAMLYACSRGKDAPIPIAFVFQQVGPTLFTKDAWKQKAGFGTALAMAGAGIDPQQKKLTGRELESVIKSVSPALLVETHSVPMILAYGAKDSLILPIHGQKMQQALQRHGIPHKLIIYPNSGHFLCEDPEYAKKYRTAVSEYCGIYFKKE